VIGTDRIRIRRVFGPEPSAVRQVGLADSRLAHLARAIRWIRGHYKAVRALPAARPPRENSRRTSGDSARTLRRLVRAGRGAMQPLIAAVGPPRS
jgi:hypothetical protein